MKIIYNYTINAFRSLYFGVISLLWFMFCFVLFVLFCFVLFVFFLGGGGVNKETNFFVN